MLRETLIAKTLRMPRVEGPPGDGQAAARALDVALLSVGFTCSRELLEHLFGSHPAAVHDAGQIVLKAVRERVGDHVQHNAYFKTFPHGVPDTLDFWANCIADALLDPRSAGVVAPQLARGTVNLLDLPIYGRYQHTYEELLAAHDELVLATSDRVDVLALGGTFVEESRRLYLQLARGLVPLNEEDLKLLGELAELHLGDEPEIGVRESRAVVNRVRFDRGLPLEIDTHTDVLRLACALSGGDVTLVEPTRFRSFWRPERRALLRALDEVSKAKLPDVNRHAERFKRLGERLHPHEYKLALDVFAVARGEQTARSIASRVELALARGRPDQAVAVLEQAPGNLVRSLDRLIRSGADVTDALRRRAPDVSVRVLLSLREHLLNRDAPAPVRTFVNREGRTWVTTDLRPPLDAPAVIEVLDAEIAARLPRLEVDPEAHRLAVPLSDKRKPEGMGILARGSRTPVGRHVRFFICWKQHARITDYDLSVQLLDEHFLLAGQISYTNLSSVGAVHSGDITSAPEGASEFIDIDLSAIKARYVVPTVNVFSGEGFDDADEAFFGYMERPPEQRGRPFEPRTVRAKSDLSGGGRVMVPLVFDVRGEALWLHLNQRGHPNFNRVEEHHRSTSLIVRGIVERRYLTLGWLEELTRNNPGPPRTIGMEEAVRLAELLNPV